MRKTIHVFAVAVWDKGEMIIMSPWYCDKCCCETEYLHTTCRANHKCSDAEHEHWCRSVFIYRHAISTSEWDPVVDWPGEEGCRRGHAIRICMVKKCR